MQKNEVEIFYPTSQTMWRKWLQENHISKQDVWLVFPPRVVFVPPLQRPAAALVSFSTKRIQRERPRSVTN
jgi:hypothetical protein